MSNVFTQLYGKTSSRPLPTKELAAFKSLLKLLDQKQYKKALKVINDILKKFPDHGETLAMKAYTIRAQHAEKKDESYEVLKKGLAKDIKSHLCWHVYAMLAQQDRLWLEAVKCYRNALRADENNMRLLKELAALLVQVRDTAGYVEMRQKIFNLEPRDHINWITLAIAHHLHGQYDDALAKLQAYEKATHEKIPIEPHTACEFQLFKNTVIEQAKSAQEALTHLEQVGGLIPDKITFKERKVTLCLKAGKQAEAEKVYRELLQLNPENYTYYMGLQKAMGLAPVAKLSPEKRSKLQETFAELQKLYPRANAPTRLVLDVVEGDAFTEELGKYVRPRLRSGKPSLFSELKSLYARTDGHKFDYPDKVHRIEKEIEGYLSSLNAHKKFSSADAGEESPSTLLFALHFAAQHYDATRDHTRALDLIEQGIAHTPTLINLYVAKARIYKHAGNFREAAAQMEVARKLDLADRYLNTVSTKYQLRAGLIEQGEATVGLFTKWDSAGQSNLFEMQASWYETALAAAYRRAGDLPHAITQYSNVLKHYNDFEEDQLDFHAYCVRMRRQTLKVTLVAYLDMLRWEDSLHTHRFYYRAATNLIECYLQWLDERAERERQQAEAEVMAKAAAENESAEARAKRKQEENKKRRAEARAAEANKEKEGEAGEASDNKPPSPNAPVDMSKVDALAEATKVVKILEKSNADKLHTHVLAVQVYLHADQFLAALAAFKKAKALQPDHPDVHRSRIRLSRHASAKDEESVLGGEQAEQVNDAFLAQHANSLPHLLAGAEMKVLLGGDQKKQESAKLLTRTDAVGTLHDTMEAYRALQGSTLGDVESAAEFKQQAHQRFPLASAFAPPEGESTSTSTSAAAVETSTP